MLLEMLCFNILTWILIEFRMQLMLDFQSAKSQYSYFCKLISFTFFKTKWGIYNNYLCTKLDIFSIIYVRHHTHANEMN